MRIPLISRYGFGYYLSDGACTYRILEVLYSRLSVWVENGCELNERLNLQLIKIDYNEQTLMSVMIHRKRGGVNEMGERKASCLAANC